MSTGTPPQYFARGAMAVWALVAAILQLPRITDAGWPMALLLIPAVAGLGVVLIAQVRKGRTRIPLPVPLILGSLALFLAGLAAGIALASSSFDPRVMPVAASACAHAAVAVGAYTENRHQLAMTQAGSPTP